MRSFPISLLRQTFLILLIVVIFGVLFWNLHFFVPSLLGAYTLYVLLRGPLLYITTHWRLPNKLAVSLLVILSFIAILLPFNWVVFMMRGQVIALYQHSDAIIASGSGWITKIEQQYNISLLNPDNLKSASDWTLGSLQQVVGATLNGLGQLIATFFILWFMLSEWKKMEDAIYAWMPLRHENIVFVKKRLNEMVWSNALGIPLMAIVQGSAGLLIYWILGVPDPWVWFALTFVGGMMPVVGAALAYVPLALVLFSQGEEGKALIILLYGVIVVGSVDNIARMWLLRKIGQTHPLITLFGVLVGLKLFGFIGFVFGPILMSLFTLLLEVYHKEFKEPTNSTTSLEPNPDLLRSFFDIHFFNGTICASNAFGSTSLFSIINRTYPLQTKFSGTQIGGTSCRIAPVFL